MLFRSDLDAIKREVPSVSMVTPTVNSRGQLVAGNMNWNTSIRQIHRWLSIAFTATVIANFVAMALGEPPALVVYSPLLPLFLLLFTGLYMFVLPYTAKLRGERGAAG